MTLRVLFNHISHIIWLTGLLQEKENPKVKLVLHPIIVLLLNTRPLFPFLLAVFIFLEENDALKRHCGGFLVVARFTAKHKFFRFPSRSITVTHHTHTTTTMNMFNSAAPTLPLQRCSHKCSACVLPDSLDTLVTIHNHP